MLRPVTIAAAALFLAIPAYAAPKIDVSIAPVAGTPRSPQMGDNIVLDTIIRNAGTEQAEGLIAWLSLVEVDKGHEQPVDLEDWSAHKAVTGSVAPGQAIRTTWPIRLIRAGDYRAVVSVASRTGSGLVVSPFVDFSVRPKPVVESGRIIPVALGIPALLALGVALRSARRVIAPRPEAR